ncbi:hypothetical protein PG991_012127 [Apiospora marii]|uniref:CCHC-type domain-containing protein n=1 Tax=Apiospora marii TaxID=335849 RepID=A0ABR1R9T0_9PEZI
MADDQTMDDASSSAAAKPQPQPQPEPTMQGQLANQIFSQNASNLPVIEYTNATYNPGEHERPAKRQRADGAQPWHTKRIQTVGPAESRVDKDQHGNIVIKNKSGKFVLPNRALWQPRTPTVPRRVLATFDHTAGISTLSTEIENTWEKDTKYTVLVMEHSEGEVPAPPDGSSLTLPMLPHNHDSAWSAPARSKTPKEAEQCANCGRFGHRLIDCCMPHEKHGDIFGCPICNTRRHTFDDCENMDYLNPTAIFNILCSRRAGKPMIRTNTDVYLLAREVHHNNPEHFPKDFAFPWTREGALRILAGGKEALSTIDYTGAKAKLGHAQDSWASYHAVLESDNPPNGSFTYWSQKHKEAAKQKPKPALPNIDTTKFTIRPPPGPTNPGS